MATPIDIVVLKCGKNFSYGKSVKSCVINRTKKISAPFQAVVTALIALRGARLEIPDTLLGPAPNIWLTMFQNSSKSVHFRQSYSRTRD